MKYKNPLLLFIVFLLSYSISVAQATSDNSLNMQSEKNSSYYQLTGLYNVTTIGVLSGSSSNRQVAPFSFQSLLMYPLNDHVALGAGMGVEFLEETYLPIVLDFRYYMRGSRFSPFVFIQSGYSLPTTKEANQHVVYEHYDIWPGPYPESDDVQPVGGFLLNPGFGIRHMFHPDFGLEISFSYRFQNLNYESKPNTRLEAEYNRLNIRIGILFQ